MQLKHLGYSFNAPRNNYPFNNENDKNEQSNPLKKMNEDLYNDTDILVDKLYNYEKDGKKNIIIGKPDNFSYFFALYLKKIEKEHGFEKLIEILQNNPDLEEIYTIFFILYHCFDYIHIDFFKEKETILRKSYREFMNGFNDNEMNIMYKDLINITINLFKKINSINLHNAEVKNEDEEFLYLKKINLSLMDIKANSFNIRLNGIMNLDDSIKNRKEKMKKKILELLKKHNIIKEIFGPNYHCEIINNSKGIIQFLLSEKQLNQEDIKIIWNCTQLGDSEAKETILNLLLKLADNLKGDYSIILLRDIKETTYDNEISNEELNLVYALTMNIIDHIDINKNSNTNNKNNLMDENAKFVDSNKIIEVKFVSFDQKIECQMKCLPSDTLAKIEGEVYKMYPEYRKTNNNFVTNGSIVIRFQTLAENDIKNGQIIELIKGK